MSCADISIVVIVSVLFAAALGYIIYRKIRRKGGCGCDCGNCASCSHCKHETDKH